MKNQYKDSEANGVKAIKNGKKVIQYKKKDEDVLNEELKRLIESAYACFDQTDFAVDPFVNIDDVENNNLHPKEGNKTKSSTESTTLLQK